MPLLENQTLMQVAKKHQCTPAQVALAWTLSKGIAIVTKTENPSRMSENLQAMDLQLAQDDLEAISGLNLGLRKFWNPYNIP